ncbi:unnamed protein product, partial [Prorocentrum cordatum]
MAPMLGKELDPIFRATLPPVLALARALREDWIPVKVVSDGLMAAKKVQMWSQVQGPFGAVKLSPDRISWKFSDQDVLTWVTHDGGYVDVRDVSDWHFRKLLVRGIEAWQWAKIAGAEGFQMLLARLPCPQVKCLLERGLWPGARPNKAAVLQLVFPKLGHELIGPEGAKLCLRCRVLSPSKAERPGAMVSRAVEANRRIISDGLNGHKLVRFETDQALDRHHFAVVGCQAVAAAPELAGEGAQSGAWASSALAVGSAAGLCLVPR